MCRALADIGSRSTHCRVKARLADQSERFAEFAQFPSRQHPEAGDFLHRLPARCVRLVQTIERRSEFRGGTAIGLQVRTFAGQQISALLRLGIGYERKEFVERLFTVFGVLHSLLGRIQSSLTGSGNEEKSDEKADQQHRRQHDVPPARMAQFLAENFHVNMPNFSR
jgi:hypothetical protein